jgi:hypothetical protein
MPKGQTALGNIGGIVRGLAVAAMVLLLALPSSDASGSDTSSDLAPDKPIEVAFEAADGELVLEVDNIDVTSLAAWSKGAVVYTPVPALGPGSHKVRVSRTLHDETAVVVDRTITVRAQGLRFDGDVHGNYQSTRGLASDPDANGANDANTGGLQTKAEVQYGDAKLAANASANYSGDGVAASSSIKLDLADWSAVATVPTKYANLTLNGGTHSSAIESLIVGPLTSRGFTLAAASEDQDFVFKGFARSTTATNGSRNFFGLELPQNQVAGVGIEVRVLESLRAEGTIYVGERGTRGKSAANVSGEGWSFALDNVSADKKFHARAEYAQTTADVDGPAGDAPSRKDRAFIFSAEYEALAETLPDGRAMQVALRGEYSSTGSNFVTLARTSTAPDQTQLLLRSNFVLGSFNLDAELKRASDNVAGLPGLPTNMADSATATFVYNDAEESGVAGLNWTLGLSYQGVSMKDLPKDFLPEERVDSELASASLGVSGQGALLGWSLMHTYALFDDGTNASQSYADHVTQASVTYRLEPFQIQSGVLHSYRIGREFVTADLSPTFSINGTFLEDRISIAASYGGLLPYRTANDDTQTVSANVSAVVVKPQEYLPGLTLNLGYAYNNTQSAFPVSRNELFFGAIQFSR